VRPVIPSAPRAARNDGGYTELFLPRVNNKVEIANPRAPSRHRDAIFAYSVFRFPDLPSFPRETLFTVRHAGSAGHLANANPSHDRTRERRASRRAETTSHDDDDHFGTTGHSRLWSSIKIPLVFGKLSKGNRILCLPPFSLSLFLSLSLPLSLSVSSFTDTG